jgi:hypothetical protein
VRAASIIRAMMMEATHASETSVDIQLRTRQYIPEDSELHLWVYYGVDTLVLIIIPKLFF